MYRNLTINQEDNAKKEKNQLTLTTSWAPATFESIKKKQEYGSLLYQRKRTNMSDVLIGNPILRSKEYLEYY